MINGFLYVKRKFFHSSVLCWPMIIDDKCWFLFCQKNGFIVLLQLIIIIINNVIWSSWFNIIIIYNTGNMMMNNGPAVCVCVCVCRCYKKLLLLTISFHHYQIAQVWSMIKTKQQQDDDDDTPMVKNCLRSCSTAVVCVCVPHLR